jgi:hypothetical protein
MKIKVQLDTELLFICFSNEAAVAFVGFWILLGALAGLKFMRQRPGPPLNKSENVFLYSWKRRKIKNIV